MFYKLSTIKLPCFFHFLLHPPHLYSYFHLKAHLVCVSVQCQLQFQVDFVACPVENDNRNMFSEYFNLTFIRICTNMEIFKPFLHKIQLDTYQKESLNIVLYFLELRALVKKKQLEILGDIC